MSGRWFKRGKHQRRNKDRNSKHDKRDNVSGNKLMAIEREILKPVATKSGDDKKATGVVRYYSPPPKECHTDPCEIVKNLWIGSGSVKDEMAKKCNVLVPLDGLTGMIWKNGFREEIMYVPISDYQALPQDVLSKYVDRVLALLENGNKVGVFCIGGHGRTGYFVSAILWAMRVPQRAGFTDPIGYMRKKYCEKAVESDAQMKSLSLFTGVPDLGKIYPQKTFYTGAVAGFARSSYGLWGDDYGYAGDYGYGGYYSGSTKKMPDPKVSDVSAQIDVDREAQPYSVKEDPCYDCLHCDECITIDNCLDLRCEMGNKVGTRCVDFYHWDDERKDAVHSSDSRLLKV